MSTWVTEIELTAPTALTLPDDRSAALILVRARGTPLGCIWLQRPKNSRVLDLKMIEAAVTDHLSVELTRQAFAREFLPPLPEEKVLQPISVIVCTRNRPELLRGCLQRLAELDYPEYEVVVVDNVPTDSRTRGVAAEFAVRYVSEPRPGLDWARNRGVIEAGHGLVAFIDDDARADRGWLRALNGAFADDQVMAVTGLVLPLDLRSSPQTYFEFVYGGMGKGYLPRSFRRERLGDSGLLWASAFGVGANMAFRKSLFDLVGAFDVALDVGTASRGGGDVELFHRLVARGYLLRYHPEAIIWHEHRPGARELRRQIFANGCSVWPYLLTCWRNRTVSPWAILNYALRQVLGWWLLRRLFRPGRHSRKLVLWELAGYFLGLAAYFQARLVARRVEQMPKPESVQSIPAAGLRSASRVRAKVVDE